MLRLRRQAQAAVVRAGQRARICWSATAASAASCLRLGGALRRGSTCAEEAGASSCAPAPRRRWRCSPRRPPRAARSGSTALAGIPGERRRRAAHERRHRSRDRRVRARGVGADARPSPNRTRSTPQYFYRHTTLARDAIVARVTLAFERGDPRGGARADAGAAGPAQRDAAARNFPTPARAFATRDGDKAGRLIEAVGRQGLARGRSGSLDPARELHRQPRRCDGRATSRRCWRASGAPCANASASNSQLKCTSSAMFA